MGSFINDVTVRKGEMVNDFVTILKSVMMGGGGSKNVQNWVTSFMHDSYTKSDTLIKRQVNIDFKNVWVFDTDHN